MLESAFEIDDNIAIYDGYTDGTHWNGWACPWFTKATALEIADDYNVLMPDDKARAIYNETEDTFIFYGYDEAETEEFKWEVECSEYTYSEARQRLKEYRENSCGRFASRMKCHREKVEKESTVIGG